MGFHDYYIKQGIHQLTAMFGHEWQNSETSKLIQIELQWCQVQAGAAKQLLAEPNNAVDYIETCWIMNIRDFLQTYKLSINLTTCNISDLQSFHDSRRDRQVVSSLHPIMGSWVRIAVKFIGLAPNQ